MQFYEPKPGSDPKKMDNCIEKTNVSLLLVFAFKICHKNCMCDSSLTQLPNFSIV